MENSEINFERITFKQKPIPIPVDYRPTYKISIILLVLKFCCIGETSSLLKLHLFSWVLKFDKNMDLFQKFILSNYKDEFQVWSIEPALNRALQYAIADNLCELTSTSKYKLTEKGNLFCDSILNSEAFEKEITFLKFVGKNKITDSRLNSMIKQWKIEYD